MAGSLGFLLTRSAQVDRHRAMHRRAFTKTTPIGSEISPGMMILSIGVLAAEKTRRQDGREGAWPWGGGVIVARAQKSRLRHVGEVCYSNFGVGSFSLDFSVGFGGGGGSSRCVLVVCSFWLYENLIRRETRFSKGRPALPEQVTMRTQSAASPGSVQKSITAVGAAVHHGDNVPASPQHMRLVNPGRIAMVPSTVPVRQRSSAGRSPYPW